MLIIGGASGLGFSLAKLFVEAESKVIICDLTIEKIEEAKKKLSGLEGFVANLAVREDRENLFKRVIRDFPEVSILINNAGICVQTDFTKEIPSDEFEKEIVINFIVPVEMIRLFLQDFLKKEKAAIINICSECGVQPFYPIPMYTGTKAGMAFFTEALRGRLKNQLHYQGKKMNILISEVYPPTLDTQMNDRWTNVKKVHPDVVAAIILKGIEANKTCIWAKHGEVRVYHFMSKCLIRFLRAPRKIIRSIRRVLKGERIAW